MVGTRTSAAQLLRMGVNRELSVLHKAERLTSFFSLSSLRTDAISSAAAIQSMLKSSESPGRFSPISAAQMMLENGIDAFTSAFLSVQPVLKIRSAR